MSQIYKGTVLAVTPNTQATHCNDTHFSSQGDAKSREGFCAEKWHALAYVFQRLTLVNPSNRSGGGKAETSTTYYNGVATGKTNDCINPSWIIRMSIF